jgi:hypothetical protein
MELIGRLHVALQPVHIGQEVVWSPTDSVLDSVEKKKSLHCRQSNSGLFKMVATLNTAFYTIVLLVLATTGILGTEPHGIHDHSLLSDFSESNSRFSDWCGSSENLVSIYRSTWSHTQKSNELTNKQTTNKVTNFTERSPS